MAENRIAVVQPKTVRRTVFVGCFVLTGRGTPSLTGRPPLGTDLLGLFQFTPLRRALRQGVSTKGSAFGNRQLGSVGPAFAELLVQLSILFFYAFSLL